MKMSKSIKNIKDYSGWQPNNWEMAELKLKLAFEKDPRERMSLKQRLRDYQRVAGGVHG